MRKQRTSRAIIPRKKGTILQTFLACFTVKNPRSNKAICNPNIERSGFGLLEVIGPSQYLGGNSHSVQTLGRSSDSSGAAGTVVLTYMKDQWKDRTR